MLRSLTSAILSLAVVFSFGFAHAEDAQGLKCGDSIGAFYVTKVAGADSDGVDAGEKLCYRCKYQSRPMVMIFSRSTDESVGQLAKQLNEAVSKNEEKQLRSFITMMGKDEASVKASAEKFAKAYSLTKVPVTIAEEVETGPSNYSIDPKADVTVIVANEGEVVATHTFSASKLDAAAVMKDVEKALN